MTADGPVVMAYGPCVACLRPFYFNPHAVPSIRVRGVREPVCADCMERVNAERRAAGLPPFEVRPDAYEPLPADEL